MACSSFEKHPVLFRKTFSLHLPDHTVLPPLPPTEVPILSKERICNTAIEKRFIDNL